MIEFAVAIPIFLVLLFGTIEVALAYKARSAYQEGALEAVRVAAAAGNAGDADQQALDQLTAMLTTENLNNIQSVTIFDATASGAMVSPGSLTTSTTYVYNASLKAFVCQSTGAPLVSTSSTPCANGSNWTPSTRSTVSGALDHVGMQIAYTYHSITGILPTLTITETASTVMEPYSFGS